MTNKFSQDEHTGLKRLLTEKIHDLKKAIVVHQEQIAIYESTLSKLAASAANMDLPFETITDNGFLDFVAVFEETGAKYLKPSQIHEAYYMRTGTRLTRYRYQKYLEGRSQYKFVKKGDKGSAKWKLEKTEPKE